MKDDVKLGFEVRTLNNMMMRNFASAVKYHGLDEVTIMHGWIIGYLYRNKDKEVYQKDLEASFAIGRSTVTNIVQLMEKKGYLVRESVNSDARLKCLRLTETGMKLHEDTEHLLDTLDRRTISQVPLEELEIFYRVIGRLKHNLEQQQAERRQDTEKRPDSERGQDTNRKHDSDRRLDMKEEQDD